jgi:hypothetical protein
MTPAKFKEYYADLQTMKRSIVIRLRGMALMTVLE